MKSVVVGTAGHIDHGKSALVRALTGTDPDRLKEEKARGITIDLGFAHTDLEGVNFAFVDVPGHERFVKNMLAGAGGIDIVLLVVAADESVMPQTREHFQIARLLHVPRGAVVLTKRDLADADMLELARLEVRELTAGSFLADAPIVPVSSVTGEGLDELRRVLLELSRGLPARSEGGTARLPIDRVFSVHGFGTVVTGTLTSGTLREGDELVILPGALPAKLRGLQVHGQAAAAAGAGRRVAVNLAGVQHSEVSRGDTLAAPGTFEPTRRIDAAIELIADARPLAHGARIRFHQGTAELLGRVAIASVGDADDASRVPGGGSAFVRIRLERPAVVTRGDRFIMRAYSPPVTIGGGAILDPHPPRTAIRTAAGKARFARIDRSVAPEEAAAAFILERGAGGLEEAALVSRTGLTSGETSRVVERLGKKGQVQSISGVLVAREVLEQLSEALLAAVKAHHEAQPLSEGLPREEARERLFGRASPVVFEHVLTTLASSGGLVARDRLALATHRITLSDEDASAMDRLVVVYREAGLQPPDLATASAKAGVTPEIAERVMKILLRNRTLVKLDVLLFHAEALRRLKDEIRATGASQRIDVATFKERYGMTRKFAIPLLEYLDRERVTRRVGDGRVVL